MQRNHDWRFARVRHAKASILSPLAWGVAWTVLCATYRRAWQRCAKFHGMSSLWCGGNGPSMIARHLTPSSFPLSPTIFQHIDSTFAPLDNMHTSSARELYSRDISPCPNLYLYSVLPCSSHCKFLGHAHRTTAIYITPRRPAAARLADCIGGNCWLRYDSPPACCALAVLVVCVPRAAVGS